MSEKEQRLENALQEAHQLIRRMTEDHARKMHELEVAVWKEVVHLLVSRTRYD